MDLHTPHAIVPARHGNCILGNSGLPCLLLSSLPIFAYGEMGGFDSHETLQMQHPLPRWGDNVLPLRVQSHHLQTGDRVRVPKAFVLSVDDVCHPMLTVFPLAQKAKDQKAMAR